MVYLEPVHLGWEPLFITWKEKMVEEIPEPYLSTIVDNSVSIFKFMFPFIRKKCKEMVASVDNNLVASCLNLLETFLSSKGLDLKKTASSLPFPNKAVMTYLCFSIIWSLGANLHDSSRQGFIETIRAQLKKRFNDFPDGDVYEYGIDPELHKLELWTD